MAEEKATQGYKIVDRNLRSMNGFQYAVGETATERGECELYENGLHFSRLAVLCYDDARESNFQPPLRYLLVAPRSSVFTDDDDPNTSATMNLHVVREFTRDEWMKIIYDQMDKLTEDDAQDAMYAAGCEGDAKLIQSIKAKVHAALTGAARYGHIDTVRWIIEQYQPTRASLNFALEAAAAFGGEAMARLLIESGAKNFYPPLLMAASTGNIFMMEFFVTLGEKITHELMDAAIEGGQASVVTWLIAHKIMPTHIDLNEAAANGNPDLVRTILKHEDKVYTGFRTPGLDVIASESSDPISWLSRMNTAFRFAARFNKVAVMEVLATAGADNFDEALREAGENNQLEAMEFAMRRGARDTCSVLQHAVRGKSIEVVRFLVQHGVLDDVKRMIAQAETMTKKQ